MPSGATVGSGMYGGSFSGEAGASGPYGTRVRSGGNNSDIRSVGHSSELREVSGWVGGCCSKELCGGDLFHSNQPSRQNFFGGGDSKKR